MPSTFFAIGSAGRGSPALWRIKGDIAWHHFRDEEGCEQEWGERVKGKM
jgi:hypothetical protein